MGNVRAVVESGGKNGYKDISKGVSSQIVCILYHFGIDNHHAWRYVMLKTEYFKVQGMYFEKDGLHTKETCKVK